MHIISCTRNSSIAKAQEASPVVSSKSYPQLVDALATMNANESKKKAPQIVETLEGMIAKGYRLDSVFNQILQSARNSLRASRN